LEKKWKKVQCAQCETVWINKHRLYNYCGKSPESTRAMVKMSICKVASHLSRADTLTEERAGGEEGDGGGGGEEEDAVEEDDEEDDEMAGGEEGDGGGEEEDALEEEEEDDSGDDEEDDGMNG